MNRMAGGGGMNGMMMQSGMGGMMHGGHPGMQVQYSTMDIQEIVKETVIYFIENYLKISVGKLPVIGIYCNQ
jgi:hypothetical protein